MDPYVGEIRMFGGNYAPEDWALCNGGTVPVANYSALFALIGTTYGGDGVTTIGLPDLRGRLPVGQGQGTGLTNRTLAQSFGTETVTLTTANLPVHNHQIYATTAAATSDDPGPTMLLGAVTTAMYATTTDTTKIVTMADQCLGDSSGGGYYHDNVMESYPINFIISLNGLFPQQN